MLPVMRILAAAALALSCLLLAQSLGASGVPGCGGSGGCDAVLASRWASWLGVPVSVLAVALYASVLGLLLRTGPAAGEGTRSLAWRTLTGAAVAIALAAAWFIAVQWLVLGRFCPLCMATHAAGLVLALLILLRSPARRGAPVAVGVAAAAALVIGQVIAPAPGAHVERLGGVPDFDTGPAHGQKRTMSILSGKVRLNPAEYPMLGPVDAEQVVVLLYDYTCEHCRAVHTMVREAVARYRGQLAVVLLPVPLSPECNPNLTRELPGHENACEYARLAMALWQVDPSAFARFDRFMFDDEARPSVDAARAFAGGLASGDELDAALRSGRPGDMIERFTKVQEISGQRVLPMLVARGLIITGRPASSLSLFSLFETELGLVPPREGAPVVTP